MLNPRQYPKPWSVAITSEVIPAAQLSGGGWMTARGTLAGQNPSTASAANHAAA
jgi:hypothetical protein